MPMLARLLFATGNSLAWAAGDKWLGYDGTHALGVFLLALCASLLIIIFVTMVEDQ